MSSPGTRATTTTGSSSSGCTPRSSPSSTWCRTSRRPRNSWASTIPIARGQRLQDLGRGTTTISWPAEYLIDATGHRPPRRIRRGRLRDDRVAHPPCSPRPRQGEAATAHRRLRTRRRPTPLTPESYLGYDTGSNTSYGSTITEDQPAAYQFPTTVPPGRAWPSRGPGPSGPEKITAGPNAQDRARLHGATTCTSCSAGNGNREGHGQRGHTPRRSTSSGIPRLYTLVSSSSSRTATLVLDRVAGRRRLRLHLRLTAASDGGR